MKKELEDPSIERLHQNPINSDPVFDVLRVVGGAGQDTAPEFRRYSEYYNPDESTSPPYHVMETDGYYYLRLSILNIDPDSVCIAFEGTKMLVSGKRWITRSGSFKRVKSSFHRIVDLPGGVEDDDERTVFVSDDETLLLVLPKRDAI